MVREVEQAVPREGQGKARQQDVLHDVLQVREMDSGWQRLAEANEPHHRRAESAVLFH